MCVYRNARLESGAPSRERVRFFFPFYPLSLSLSCEFFFGSLPAVVVFDPLARSPQTHNQKKKKKTLLFLLPVWEEKGGPKKASHNTKRAILGPTQAPPSEL